METIVGNNSEFNLNGYNDKGFDEDGFHQVTGSIYDSEGFDEDGYDIDE